MDKPISMIIRESKSNIVKAINECKLHPSILEIILKDIYTETIETSKRISEIEEKEYLLKQNTKEQEIKNKTENK